MKKKIFLITVCLLLSSFVVSAIAAGDSRDPLISLSYLTDTFTKSLERQINKKLDESDEELLSGIDSDASVETSIAENWTETRLKAQDILAASTGTNVMVLAGNVTVSFTSGTVVDVTTGSTVVSDTALTANHRYMVAEDTEALFTVTSKTAVVDYQGAYEFIYSDAVDYNAIAGALKTMNLFKGSFTGYGQGYDLEVAPTRLQALIMFIRVLGEEEAALAYTGSTHFDDIAKGTQAEKYVGYAYSMGYTNGYSATTFRPSQAIPVNQYMEFVLRALGYSDAATSNLSTTMARALESGVITSGEFDMLQGGTFLRADLAYISYYALDTQVAGTRNTLKNALQDRGVFTASDARAAARMIPSSRK